MLSLLLKLTYPFNFLKIIFIADNLTIFAPTNYALQDFDSTIENNPKDLRSLLLFHVAPGRIMLSHMKDGQIFDTYMEDKLRINRYQKCKNMWVSFT